MKIVSDGTVAIDGKVYERAYVSCGKAKCHCMREGTLHGPYWYRRVQQHGRTIRRYIGRQLVPDGAQAGGMRTQHDSNKVTVLEDAPRDMFAPGVDTDSYYGTLGGQEGM